ncbi:M56 family metallopeptidase [Lachnospiraceae bacterium OttesenSCG-928-D06]|nr:M56 family metallopeptidase [Lachnospiraceae bacterium OttesenSCG-928-D06]
MNIMELNFSEIMEIFLKMSFVGSVVALGLFIVKPVIKDRLSKSCQYYMWFVVLMALILPLSQIIVLPESSASSNHIISFTPIYNTVQQISYTTSEEPAPFLTIATIFFILWQLGIYIFLCFNIICYLLFACRLKKNSIPASSHEMELLQKVARKGSVPCLYTNSMVTTPMLIGIFCPRILLPDKKYTETQLQHIFLHELTHFYRYDIVMKWLWIFVGALHWFNPMVYLIRREFDRACELACDERVIKNLDTKEKQNYGNVLITVAANNKNKMTVSNTMCRDKKLLKERLGAIMKYKTFSKKTMVLSGVFLMVLLCGTFYLGAESSEKSTRNEGILTNAELSPLEREKIEKEIEIQEIISDFDKNKIADVSVSLRTSDTEIIGANIYIRCHEEIKDSGEKDSLLSLAGKHLNLDIQNIEIKYVDMETFTSTEKGEGEQ